MSQVFPFRYIGDQMGLGCQGFQPGRSTQPMLLPPGLATPRPRRSEVQPH